MGLLDRLREKRARPMMVAWRMSERAAALVAAEHNAMGPILDALREIEDHLNTAVHYAKHDDHEEMCLHCLAEDAITKAWTALDRLDGSLADVTGRVNTAVSPLGDAEQP